MTPEPHSPEALRALADAATDREQQAGYLHDLAAMLGARGETAAAVRALSEALGIYRELDAADPNYRPHVAAMLNQLAAHRHHAGDGDGAADAAREAVGHFRSLAGMGKPRYLNELAMALNNLGAILGDRDPAGSLAACEEAAQIYAPLAEGDPETYTVQHAVALHNLGDRQRAGGDPRSAFTTLEQALRVLLPQFKTAPNALEPRAHALARDYLDAAEKTQQQPNGPLTMELVKLFNQVYEGRKDA